jgi:ketol-acid reductoisomerase
MQKRIYYTIMFASRLLSTFRSFRNVRQLHTSRNIVAESSVTVNVGGTTTDIIPSTHETRERFADYNNDGPIAVIGYGSQGRAQALNLRDGGHDVILGLRYNGTSWNKALDDGWRENSIMPVELAVTESSRVHLLIPDFALIDEWQPIMDNMSIGSCDQICVSHGFGFAYHDLTNITAPPYMDVFMVAPKCSGNKVRESFVNGKLANASYAVYHDASGIAKERCIAAGLAVGCTNLFETTFTDEVVSDLTGERLVLMGTIRAIMEAQYEILREHGHSPMESYNETLAEAEHLYQMMWEKGMDWLYKNCSTTAQTGALEWSEKLKPNIKVMFEECYQSVLSKTEAQKAIQASTDPEYRKNLDQQLDDMADHELWRVNREMIKLNEDLRESKSE